MADLHLRREHTLGLARARKVALKWAEDMESKLEMACTLVEGDDGDVIEFTRAGVNGSMTVTASHFDLEATLGFLFSSFSEQIEQKISRNLDELLDSPNGGTRFA